MNGVQVETYPLSVESGKGWDLNVSLFERLVLQPQFPHATLGVQWRMHPAIADLIRPTYPRLQDHPTVQSHQPVRGLASGTHVAFIDHRYPELSEAKGREGQWSAANTMQSKVNMHEVCGSSCHSCVRLAKGVTAHHGACTYATKVDMVVSSVRYLLQQGYAPDQITVLTPYLGQLLELQKALSKEFDVSKRTPWETRCAS